jgi:hypothetical protein
LQPTDDTTILDSRIYERRLLNEDDGEFLDATVLGYG